MNRKLFNLILTNKNLNKQVDSLKNCYPKIYINFAKCLYTENKNNNFSNYLSKNRSLHLGNFTTGFRKDNWSEILIKAEKVVGYPTSFLNLRYLVSDEVAHFAQLLRKLMQTKHPLIKMARRFILSTDKAESKRTLQVNGLIVLLISKAVGQPSTDSLFALDVSDGIHNSQRCLAEIAEMIDMGTIIHRGILDLKTVDVSEVKDMDQGNKLAVLCGDYLLANACNNLAKLGNTEVVDLMSQVISDISEGIFRKKSDLNFLKLWLDNINSTSSSLLANSARSAMVLVENPSNLQDTAFNFALNLDIAHKVWSEIVKYKKDNNHFNQKESIFNAIYKDRYQPKHSAVDSSITIHNSYTQEININEENKFNESILNDCKLLFENHYTLALSNLKSLELNSINSDRDAIDSLESILNVMKSSV